MLTDLFDIALVANILALLLATLNWFAPRRWLDVLTLLGVHLQRAGLDGLHGPAMG